MRMKRWSLEATFEESWAHLGMETRAAVVRSGTLRSMPLLLGLYSLVTLFWHAPFASS
jgi:hypothetical protein